MQSDSQFGGSTPSIYNAQATNYDHSDYNKIDFSKNFDHNETKTSTRNYYDVEKIDFDKSIYLNGPPHSSESSSSENSIFSDGREHESENKIILNNIEENAIAKRSIKNLSILPRCKNSTENLSEDSGYGEFSSLKHHRSKSIPSFNQDYFIEEEELENHKSLENVYSRLRFCNGDTTTKIATPTTASNIHSRNGSEQQLKQLNIEQASQRPKIDATKRCSISVSSTIESKNIRGHGEVQHNATDASRKTASSALASSLSSLQNNIISASLPDILDHLSVFGEINHSESNKRKSTQNGNDLVTPFYNKDFSVVSSVPNNLNICSQINRCNSDVYAEGSDRDDIDCWSFNSVSISSRHTSGSVASKNFDLGNLDCRLNGGSGSVILTEQTFRQQKIINASYNNLTLLDYSVGSGSRTPLGSSLRIMADKQKRASLEFSRGSSLLDEISAHFDRDLSIMNDQKRNYDPSETLFRNERAMVQRPSHPPPQPPPRKQYSQQKNDSGISAAESTIKDHASDSFEKEIHHLESRFSDSLEDCNYDSDASTDNEDDDDNVKKAPVAQSTPIKREFIASTPNLYLVKRDCGEEFMPIYSAHNSMTTLPQNEMPDKGKGILSDGSRNSLGKGVSFCPVVAEISWREQSSEEGVCCGNDSRYIEQNFMLTEYKLQ